MDVVVLFVNTEFNHDRILDALKERNGMGARLHPVSVQGNLFDEDRKRPAGKLAEAIRRVMPQKVEGLLEEIIRTDGDGISCVVADQSVIGLGPGDCNKDGSLFAGTPPTKHHMIKPSQTMPAMDTAQLPWACVGDFSTQKIISDIGLITTN